MDNLDEEFSDLGRSLKQSTSNMVVYESYDRDLIENSLKKSYILQMSGSNIKEIMEKEEPDIRHSLARSKLPIHKEITSIIEESQTEEQVDKDEFFHVSNLGKVQEAMGCCTRPSEGVPAILTLTNTKQLYISRYGANTLLYSLNFNTVWAEINSRIENEGYFIINVCPELILKVEQTDKKKLKQIYQQLCLSIKHSWGKQHKMMSLTKIPNFHQNKYKPGLEFFENANTGDLLLFKGSSVIATLQRLFTTSEYDHVGMVIRDQVYGVLVFQSNSNSGVCLTPWEMVMKYKWYESIEKIVWRQLRGVKRESSFNDLIHQFVLANIGKSYYISIDKLLSRRSFIAEKKEQVGFFCSELIAAIYKDLGLLTRDPESANFKPGCNFIPYNFTQKYGLQLEEGYLSDEYILHFDSELMGSQQQP